MSAPDLLIHGCAVVTVDAAGTEYREGWVTVRGNRIDALGSGNPPEFGPEVARIDGRGCVIT